MVEDGIASVDELVSVIHASLINLPTSEDGAYSGSGSGAPSVTAKLDTPS